MKSYDTLTEAVNDLKTRGYNLDFNLKDTRLECTSTGKQLSPREFEITEFYRFEGDTDPGDELVVYAIESTEGLKGTLINAFGPYANTASDELIAKLKMHTQQ
ncbi:MAG: phosphoribosylpyrophosphate synthetase [Bacteroidota bacterium]|nr:phosphoribosylpyrophosphate synthetase [Bacteroidota bacterium]